MRYFVDKRDLEPEVIMASYRAMLPWAAGRSDRFSLAFQSGIYDDPEQEQQFRRFGTSQEINLEEHQGFFGRAITRLLRAPTILVRVEGQPSTELAHELTRIEAPLRAVGGDACPVEDIELYRGERLLFGSYDYGRDFLLDLDEPELSDLRDTLARAGVPPDRVKPLDDSKGASR